MSTSPSRSTTDECDMAWLILDLHFAARLTLLCELPGTGHDGAWLDGQMCTEHRYSAQSHLSMAHPLMLSVHNVFEFEVFQYLAKTKTPASLRSSGWEVSRSLNRPRRISGRVLRPIDTCSVRALPQEFEARMNATCTGRGNRNELNKNLQVDILHFPRRTRRCRQWIASLTSLLGACHRKTLCSHGELSPRPSQS